MLKDEPVPSMKGNADESETQAGSIISQKCLSCNQIIRIFAAKLIFMITNCSCLYKAETVG